MPISLSENASSFGTISRLNHASSRWPGCSRAQLRLRRCPSLIASPRARFTAALRRGSLPCGSLRCERLARRFDRAETMLAPCLRHARLAMTAPALEHRLAAHRARDRIGRARFDGRRAPCSRCVRSRLRGFARRCEQRRSLRTGNAAALISGFSREGARRCALVDERFAEGLCEARRDRPQAFAPMRQRECELMRQRRCDPANTVRELAKVSRSELAIFQEIEQKSIHVRAHRLHGI